jgi:hypothetical protein
MAPNGLATHELKWVFATIVRHFYLTIVHLPFIILFFPSSLSPLIFRLPSLSSLSSSFSSSSSASFVASSLDR